ncbi:GDSL esterase/lipase 5 [Glycine max]|nr:GDSL esterase/lipase 5 [Glycine max]KAH1205116.1 GDSL esterase/lipase 5 [Glycine max]KAH1205118.1 GDSL esterase/lipase 5 [Glycine max]
MVVGNLTTVIKGIHKTGGRKFGVLNQSVLGCIPLVKALVNGSEGSCVEEASALAKLHNSVLSVELENCGGKRTVKDYELCENPSDYVFFFTPFIPLKGLIRLFPSLCGVETKEFLAHTISKHYLKNNPTMLIKVLFG